MNQKNREEEKEIFREAKIYTLIAISFTVVTFILYFFTGYNRTTDPLNFPLGLPTWYTFGTLIPTAVVDVIVIWFSIKRMKGVKD